MIPFFAYSQGEWEKASVGDGSGHSKGHLAFYQKASTCEGEEGLLLKVVNRSDEELQISWRHAFLLENGWKKGEAKQLSIGGDQRLAGSCKGEGDARLWVPFPDGERSSFAIRQVKIE